MNRINLERALVFIDEHGNVQDKARLLYILMGETAPDYIVRPLLDKQNSDGGFPSRPRGEQPSSVDNTLTALWQLNELGMLGGHEAKQALGFLMSVQKGDGSWDENPALPEHDLPPWIKPGQPATCNYLTAYSAFWLGSAGMRQETAFQRAAHNLGQKQEQDGKIPGYLHSQWISTSVFFQGGDDFRNQAESGLAFLNQIPIDQWEDSQIAWAVDCLASAGLSNDHPFNQKMLSLLAERQEDEGSWSSEDGPAYAVSASISAIKVLKRFGWISGID